MEREPKKKVREHTAAERKAYFEILVKREGAISHFYFKGDWIEMAHDNKDKAGYILITIDKYYNLSEFHFVVGEIDDIPYEPAYHDDEDPFENIKEPYTIYGINMVFHYQSDNTKVHTRHYLIQKVQRYYDKETQAKAIQNLEKTNTRFEIRKDGIAIYYYR